MCKTWLAHICGELFSQIWCIRRWFWLSWLAPSPTRAFFVVTDKFSIAFALLFYWDKCIIITLVLNLQHIIPLQFLSQVFDEFWLVWSRVFCLDFSMFINVSYCCNWGFFVILRLYHFFSYVYTPDTLASGVQPWQGRYWTSILKWLHLQTCGQIGQKSYYSRLQNLRLEFFSVFVELSLKISSILTWLRL